MQEERIFITLDENNARGVAPKFSMDKNEILSYCHAFNIFMV